MPIYLDLDTFQRLAVTRAASCGIVYHLDVPFLQVRHYKDTLGMSTIVIADDSETLATIPLDTWIDYCKQITQETNRTAIAALEQPLVSSMSTQERARWLHLTKMWHVHTGITGRQAKRLAVYELQELDALQVYGKSLLSKDSPKARTQGKPARQTAHVKSRAASASSRVLFAQKMESQGKGRRIPAKRAESTAPCVKIRRK